MARGAYLKVVDHRGNRIPAASMASHAGAYEGAAYGRRMGTWGVSSAGPDSSLWQSHVTLRNRSRQLERNDPQLSGGIDTLVANLVGTGITPRWLIKNPELKKYVQQLWGDWVEECDADGVLNFYGLQGMAARAIVEGGEVLVRFLGRSLSDGLSVPLQLQVLEGDHLPSDYYNTWSENGNEIRMGIEYNARGRRAAYHIYREHPGEAYYFSDNTQTVRIPASEILHIYRPLRPGQKRGRPWLASVIVTQHELNQYDDAEVVRKKTAAMFGGFITEKPGEEEDYPVIGQKTDDDSEGRSVVGLEPGTFPVLPSGMQVNFATPADVGGNYEAFTKRHDRRVARGLGGMTYEKYTGDLKDANFSTLRGGNLDFQRMCKMMIQNVLAFQLCRQVAVRWLDTAVMSGAIDIPDYAANRRAYHRIKWDHDGWEWVDPETEVKAEKDAVRAGFKSRSQVVSERGRDAEVVDDENMQDNERADEKSLIYDSDPRHRDASGKAPAAKESDDEK